MNAQVPLRQLSVHARQFKCFADWQGLDYFAPLNLLVGRNNAGKSTVLDLIEHLQAGGKDGTRYWHDKRAPEFRYRVRLSDELINGLWQENRHLAGLGSDTKRHVRQHYGAVSVEVLRGPGGTEVRPLLAGQPCPPTL